MTVLWEKPAAFRRRPTRQGYTCRTLQKWHQLSYWIALNVNSLLAYWNLVWLTVQRLSENLVPTPQCGWADFVDWSRLLPFESVAAGLKWRRVAVKDFRGLSSPDAHGSEMSQIFNQLFNFQSYWLLFWSQLVLRSWILLMVCAPLASLVTGFS